MKQETEVLIVGAGFAGLSAAEICAKEGTDCLVIEKSPEIGYPITTSGASWIEELERLEIPPHLYHPVKRCRLISPNNDCLFDYDRPIVCILDVRGVRQFLAERALEEGASIEVRTTARDIITTNGLIRGVSARTITGKLEIMSKIVIDASGFQSIVARKAGLHNGFRRFGVGAEYDLYVPKYDQDEIILAVGTKFAPVGYGWAFPHGNNRVRVGLGLIHPDVNMDPKDYLDIFIKYLSEFGISNSKQMEYHSGVIPSQGVIERTVTDGLIVTGDAAGHPLTLVGEGIRISMLVGRLAGKVASSAVLNNEGIDKYEKMWKSKFERKLKISYLINERISQFDDKDWDKGVEMLKKLTPEQFGKLLKCEFSKKLMLDIVRRNPSLIKSGTIHILKDFLLEGGDRIDLEEGKL